MLQPRTCAAILLTLATVGATAGCSGKGGADDTTPTAVFLTGAQVVDAVTRTVETWRQAWEVRDLETISPLYAHDLDLVVIVQGQPFLGWSAVETYLATRINAATGIHITVADLQVVALGSDGASASATVTREFSDGVTTINERGVLTLGLRGSGNDWVIIAEHYSYPPTAQ